MAKIKEWPPQLYAEYNGGEVQGKEEKHEKKGLIRLLQEAPSTFWTVGLVQFFCWFAFLFMWTYTTGTVATKAFDTPVVNKITALTDGTNSVHGKYILINDTTIVVKEGLPVPDESVLTALKGPVKFSTGVNVARDHNTGKLDVLEKEDITLDASKLQIDKAPQLDTASQQYNEAGDWVGILFAVQALGSVCWAVMLPRLRSRKFSYAISLVLGGIGFILAGIISNQYLLFIPFVLIGCGWAAMLAWPFTILTNSLKGGNIGTYLGLFNCSICIPQIIAAITGGWILSAFSTPGEIAPQYVMMIVAGISLIIGALCVGIIREGSNQPQVQEAIPESES